MLPISFSPTVNLMPVSLYIHFFVSVTCKCCTTMLKKFSTSKVDTFFHRNYIELNISTESIIVDRILNGYKVVVYLSTYIVALSMELGSNRIRTTSKLHSV